MDYAIGDVHGCYDPLMRLLHRIGFNDAHDRLWFTGDLVNRGPDPVSVLRFLSALRCPPRVCLGNHDLYFLSVQLGVHPLPADATGLKPLLAAPDVAELTDWLLQQPLAHHDSNLKVWMTHAGIYPLWSLPQMMQLAQEVTACYQDPSSRGDYFSSFLGNTPNRWYPGITGLARYRFITNALTRMRYVCMRGERLLLQYNTLTDDPEAVPWFKIMRLPQGEQVVFGHWAALNGKVGVPGIYGLDTACCRGGKLTALCLQHGQRYHVVA